MENRKEGKAKQTRKRGLMRSAARPIVICLFCFSGVAASLVNSVVFQVAQGWVRAKWPLQFASDVSIRFRWPHGVVFWAGYVTVATGLLALALVLAGFVSRQSHLVDGVRLVSFRRLLIAWLVLAGSLPVSVAAAVMSFFCMTLLAGRGADSVGWVLGSMFAIAFFLGYGVVRSFFLDQALRLATGLGVRGFRRSATSVVAGLPLVLVGGGVGGLLLTNVTFVHWGWLGWFERMVLLDGPAAGAILGHWVFRRTAAYRGSN